MIQHTPMIDETDEVKAFAEWPTNAHMIVDVARCGDPKYLNGSVLDVTYGDGGFWTQWKPEILTTSDLYKPADFAWNYLHLPCADSSYQSVVFDSPYKMQGTSSSGEMDRRYGNDREYWPMADILADILGGAREAFRVCSRYALIKCQDQVVSGKVVWQTDLITWAIEESGGRKVDRFDIVTGGRKQPPGRRQIHARRNHSTLLVFKK